MKDAIAYYGTRAIVLLLLLLQFDNRLAEINGVISSSVNSFHTHTYDANKVMDHDNQIASSSPLLTIYSNTAVGIPTSERSFIIIVGILETACVLLPRFG